MDTPMMADEDPLLMDDWAHATSLATPRLYMDTANVTLTPAMIDVTKTEYGDVLVLFKVPSETRVGDAHWMEQIGMELHACLTDSDYAHCELHFVHSDVGLGCGVDVNGAVFLWNKEYDPAAYACVYRIKMKAARYNALLRWAIETVDAQPTYDRAYMTRYCWLCWFRKCLPLACSRSRQNAYTCGSLTYSALAVSGLSDIPIADATSEKRALRKTEMMEDRMVTVVDVFQLLRAAEGKKTAASADIVEVKQLAGVPFRMTLGVSRKQ